ncbi:ribonucleotide reductase inhibitor-domain-containing protein [Podospora australis]|uniref:Ribonucleotide reductase inhibitor-domain-containing protein n=1 Tax=Podospora australis TaxID=1536484 RepID=A0AAN6X337_9PEZI|nr:ribonucleotide reductase inhibitor-domain-containing protein [Podospora australis]
MSGPRTKRQFAGAASDPAQRQITSFFQRSSSSLDNTSSSRPQPLNGPVLPGQVQTNLLNVGMRVRKAVPEGYKTGTQYSAFKLWEDESLPTTISVSAASSDPVSATPNPVSSVAGGGGLRELMPFCGIHKVGGLGVQEPNSAVGGATTDESDFSGYDFPMLSQESTLSNSSTTSALEATGRAMNINGKRLFVDEEVVGEDGDFPDVLLDDSSRVLAVPRRRGGGKTYTLGQENSAVAGLNGNDFEEAPFLQYGMEVEP